VYGLITLLVATAEAGVIAAVRAVRRARARRAAARAAPLTAAQLAAAPPATRGRAAALPRELSGSAVAGPDGTLVSPLSKTKCVWYAIMVKERFHAWRPGPLGPTRVERHFALATHVSGNLELQDETGALHIDPRGAELALGAPALSEFETREAAAAPDSLTAQAAKVIGPRRRPRAATIGLVIEEVVVREGEQLHVIGHVRNDLGQLVVGKRGTQPFVISRGSALPTVGPLPPTG
jgi:hypothetical protein